MGSPFATSVVRIGLIAVALPFVLGAKCVPPAPPSGGHGGGAGGGHQGGASGEGGIGGGAGATDGGADARDGGGAPDAGEPIDAGGTAGARDAGAGASADAKSSADARASDGSAAAGACMASDTTVWTATSAPALMGSLWAIRPSDILGANAQLNRWDGSTWSPFSPQAPFSGTVVASGDDDIWIESFRSSPISVAHWDGVAWTDVSIPSLPSGTIESPVWASAPGDAWLSVAVPLPSTPQGTVNDQGTIYHWTGSTWTATSSPVDSMLNAHITSFWGSSPSDVWGVIPGAFLHWNGSTWATAASPLTSNDIVEAMWGTSAQNIWAVGGGPNARMWHFDGAAWTVVDSSFSGFFLSVWGSCASDFWATLSSNQNGASPLWHYDGNEWSPFPLVGLPLPENVITGTSPDDVWIVSNDANGRLLHRQPGRCGDGVIGPGEECDPPHQGSDGLQCDSTCHLATCGNGVIDPGEACDPPESTGTDLCSQDCQIPTCGNGVVDPGEDCEPPNTNVCDGQCHSIPIACGNGIIQPGETCDFPSGQFCVGCQITTCGACFFNSLGPNDINTSDTDFVCQALSGTDRTNCQALLNCMSQNLAQCVVTPPSSATVCYCSDATCSAGVNGPCASQFESVAGTTDSTVIIGELNEPSVLSQVRAEAQRFGGSSCGSPCSGL